MPEPTLTQIEAQLNETANTIEQAVDDINKNKASKNEVLDLIKERTGKDKELLDASQASIETLNTGYAEVKEEVDKLNDQIRNFRKSDLSSSPHTPAAGYRGYFASPQEAKTFALLVMLSATAGYSRLAEKHKTLTKSIEAMGIEPYWLDGNGRKTMTGSSQAGGGVLVTVEQIPSIKMLFEQYGVFRSEAQIVPMGAGQTVQPKTSGLLTITCPGEGGETSEQDPTLELLGLTPKTLTAMTGYSIELEDDALVALGEMLVGLFIRSFAYSEDLCGFLGDGTSTYFGFKGITGALRAVDATIGNIKSLVVAAGNAYSEITLANFQSLVGTVPLLADDNDLKWYVHKYFFWTVMANLALEAGSGTAQEILLGRALKRQTFLGHDVKFTQVMSKVEANSQIPALLANLRQGAMLGTRGGLEFATSDQRYFEKGVIAVRGRNRIAINAHGVGDTAKAGPICGLIMAAS